MNGLFGDDDDDEMDFKRKREREFGADGDGDEIDFEEDFADDEEKNPEEAEDDEMKEMEVRYFILQPQSRTNKNIQERIKKEYRKANVTKAEHDDEDDEDEQQLTTAGKAMHKVLKKADKDGQYDDSDDDKNPYASSVSDSRRFLFCSLSNMIVSGGR